MALVAGKCACLIDAAGRYAGERDRERVRTARAGARARESANRTLRRSAQFPMSGRDVGPSMPRGVLNGVQEDCTDSPECVPLPPEQRGRISRCLADDEGDDGRFMDIPKPGEVWGGVKALTKEIVTGLVPPLHPVAVRPREPVEPVGFELSEPGAGGPSFDSGKAAAEAAAEGGEQPPELRPEEARHEAGKRPYFRQEQDGGFAESPQALVGQLVQLSKEIASFMFPVHLFFPGGEEKEKQEKAAAAARAAAAAAQAAASAPAPPPQD